MMRGRVAPGAFIVNRNAVCCSALPEVGQKTQTTLCSANSLLKLNLCVAAAAAVECNEKGSSHSIFWHPHSFYSESEQNFCNEKNHVNSRITREGVLKGGLLQ